MYVVLKLKCFFKKRKDPSESQQSLEKERLDFIYKVKKKHNGKNHCRKNDQQMAFATQQLVSPGFCGEMACLILRISMKNAQSIYHVHCKCLVLTSFCSPVSIFCKVRHQSIHKYVHTLIRNTVRLFLFIRYKSGSKELKPFH